MNKYVLRNTKDYSLFSVSDVNRGVDGNHLRKLEISMKEYGWIPAFPMLVHRTKRGLEIVDGQHRFYVAKNLGISMWFVETENGFDVAKINAPQCPWKVKDYAESFAKRDVESYVEAMEFAEKHKMQIGDAAALLAGTTSYSNIRKSFVSGEFKVTDRVNAHRMGYLYTEMRDIGRFAVDQSMRLALMAVARVPGIDLGRLVRNARRQPEKLIKYGTREGALNALEEIYNFGARGGKFHLKISAENAMRDRNPAFVK
jgi:hypothetical protein